MSGNAIYQWKTSISAHFCIANTHLNPLGLLWFSVFMMGPCNALCDHLSSPNFQRRQLVPPHLPRHSCWASQGLGDLCSQQHCQLWAHWCLPMLMKLEAFVVSKVEKVFGSTHRMSAMVWQCSYIHWMLCPAQVESTGGAGTGGTADASVNTLLVSSVPNPCLPPILTKLSLEFLMALAVAFPHWWNVQPLIKDQSLMTLSSDCSVILCFPISAACVSLPFSSVRSQLCYSSSLIDASCLAPW